MINRQITVRQPSEPSLASRRNTQLAPQGETVSVGNPPTTAGVNQSLQTFAVALRDLCEDIKDYQTWIQNQGIAALEAAGFSAADAQTVLTLMSYLNTFSGVYYGTVQAGGSGGTGAIDFDYDQALSPLWGGQ